MRILTLEKRDLPNDTSWFQKPRLYEFTSSSLSFLLLLWWRYRRELNEEKMSEETGLARARHRMVPSSSGKWGHHLWPSHPHLPKRQSFKFSWIGHHLGAQISPPFLRLRVSVPLYESYKGLLCSRRKFVTCASQKPWLPLICDPGKTTGFQKERCDLCNSFFTAGTFQGNLTVMSFPCF